MRVLTNGMLGPSDLLEGGYAPADHHGGQEHQDHRKSESPEADPEILSSHHSMKRVKEATMPAAAGIGETEGKYSLLPPVPGFRGRQLNRAGGMHRRSRTAKIEPAHLGVPGRKRP